MADVRTLAADEMGGRLPGTIGSAKARAYILRRMREAGLRPLPSGWTQEFAIARRPDQPAATGVNLMGYVPGRGRSKRWLVVTAHYDHVGVRGGEVYNGADDNASGVAVLLAAAERFARRRPEHNVLFVAFDAEEGGLRGARAFIADPPVPRRSIALNVNFDMVSRGDRGEIYAAGAYPWPFLRPRLEALAARAKITLKLGHDTPDMGPSQNWITESDHYAFHAAGIPFVYFGVEDHPDYHRPTDDPEKIPQAFFAGAAETLLAAIASLDADLDAIAAERMRAGGPREGPKRP
jgi:Zn-dependent M28 family amino/carboxypeptidase